MEGEEEQEEHFFLVLVWDLSFESFFLILVLDLGRNFWIPPASNLLSVMGCHIDSCWILIFYSAFAKIALNAFPIQHVLE